MYRLQTNETTPRIVARSNTPEGIDQAFIDWHAGMALGTPPASIRLEEDCIRCEAKVVILRRVRNLEFARCQGCLHSYRYSVQEVLGGDDETPFEMVLEMAEI